MWSVDVRYRYNGETGGRSKQYNGDAQWNRRKSIVIRDGVGGRKQGGRNEGCNSDGTERWMDGSLMGKCNAKVSLRAT